MQKDFIDHVVRTQLRADHGADNECDAPFTKFDRTKTKEFKKEFSKNIQTPDEE